MPKQTILATVRSRILAALGPGPVFTCHKLIATERRDGAGNFEAEFPATDAALDAIRVKEVYLEFTVGGKFFFMGLVERVTRVMDRKGRQTLIVSGRDQLGALAENTIGNLELTWAFDAPAQIVGEANVPNQTFSISSDFTGITAYPFTKKFAGETALQALVMLSEDINEHFRAPKSPTLEVVWIGPNLPDAAVRLVASGGPRLHENPNIAVIEQVESDQNAARLVNRIYPYGAGFGSARLTLEDATTSMPTGFSMNTSANYIQHDGQQALPLLLMAQQRTWNHIGIELGQIYDIVVTANRTTGSTLIPVEMIAIPIPSGTLLDLNGLGTDFVETSTNTDIGANVLNVVATTFDLVIDDELRYIPASTRTAAANQLAYAALTHLQRLSDPDRMVAYKLTVRGLPDSVAVGERIPVLSQAPGFAIDDDLIILEITRTVTATGRMPAVLRVVPVDWFDVSEAASVAVAMEQLENLQRQEQPVDYANIANAPTLVEDFIDLGDVPSSYSGDGGLYVKVKGDETGLEFAAGSGGAVDSVNGQTGVVDLDADDIDETTSRIWFTTAEETKLAGIETGADVTDAGNIATAITGASTDNTIVDADVWGYLTGGTLVKTAWSNIKAVLKTYFDTLYNLYVHPNHSGDVTSSGDGATTIANDAVSNAKAANMAEATIKGRAAAAGTGDPTDLTAAQVLTILTSSIAAAFWTFTNKIAIAATATTGAALRVVRDLAAANTDSPVADIVQDNTGDDQAALRVQQDGTGALLELYDGTTLAVRVTDGGNVYITSATFPPLEAERTTAATSGDLASFNLKATTSNNMADGFGPSFNFQIRDNAGVSNSIGSIAFLRDGADNSGAMVINTRTAGSQNERVRILNDGKVILGLTSAGASVLGVKAGTSSNDAAVGGVLYVTTTQTGNVGTGEDDLASYSVPANTLAVNGQSLWFEAWGTFNSANANNKIVRARFGTSGTNLMITFSTITSGRSWWRMRGRIVRTGATSQKSVIDGVAFEDSGNLTPQMGLVSNLNQTLSGAVTLKVTGEGVSNSDIVCESFIVGYDDANT